MIDVNSDGLISEEDLVSMLTNLGWSLLARDECVF